MHRLLSRFTLRPSVFLPLVLLGLTACVGGGHPGDGAWEALIEMEEDPCARGDPGLLDVPRLR